MVLKSMNSSIDFKDLKANYPKKAIGKVLMSICFRFNHQQLDMGPDPTADSIRALL